MRSPSVVFRLFHVVRLLGFSDFAAVGTTVEPNEKIAPKTFFHWPERSEVSTAAVFTRRNDRSVQRGRQARNQAEIAWGARQLVEGEA